MPLNIQDSEEQKDPVPVKPQLPPTLPAPETGGGNRNILLWIFILVATASGLFLLIQFGVIPTGGDRDNTALQPRDTAASPAREMPHAPPPAAARPEDEPSPDLRERLTTIEGDYTIFISAFHDAADAEELAGRWEKAGYPAFIQHASGWYRVGLGRYPTAAIAREEAEKLRQALEDGYWIGRAEI